MNKGSGMTIHKRLLPVLAVCVLLAGCGGAAESAGGPPPAMPVTVSTPLVQDVIDWDDYVGRFEAGMLNHLRTRRRDVLDMITTQDPKIAGEQEQMLRGAIEEFARDFA